MVAARIERNRERFGGRTYPCLFCGDDLKISVDKNGKPYCGCRECGMQLFVRGEQGCDMLELQLGAETTLASSHNTPARRGAAKVFNRE
jgi:DNA-directed RNA polymerase subunit RPC12/RpoP